MLMNVYNVKFSKINTDDGITELGTIPQICENPPEFVRVCEDYGINFWQCASAPTYEYFAGADLARCRFLLSTMSP